MVDKSRTREVLLKEKARLESEMADINKGQPAIGERREGSPFGKREEEATEAAEMEKRTTIERQLLGLIGDVDRALAKLEAGSYGICDVCRQPISPERMEALPAAHLCFKCKAAQDRLRGRR